MLRCSGVSPVLKVRHLGFILLALPEHECLPGSDVFRGHCRIELRKAIDGRAYHVGFVCSGT